MRGCASWHTLLFIYIAQRNSVVSRGEYFRKDYIDTIIINEGLLCRQTLIQCDELE